MTPSVVRGYTASDVDCRSLTGDPRAAVEAWLAEHKAIGFKSLLAWSSDGVTWGRVDRPESRVELVTSEWLLPDASPGLTETLTELRLFTDDLPGCKTPGAEIHAWKGSMGWRARLIQDIWPRNHCRDTVQIAFGKGEDTCANGFTLVSEGRGLKHAPPIEWPQQVYPQSPQPLRLHVREYFHIDDGITRVGLSRLGGLSAFRGDAS